MMTNHLEDREDVVWISVPLNGATVSRLRNLSDACHADPVAVAASLLHDVLKDDETYNAPAETSAGQTLN